MAQRAKRLSAMQETRVWSLGREDPLEKEMAIHSSTLAWKIPWTEEPDRLQSMGSQRVGHDWVTSLSLHFQAMWLSANHTYISELFFSCQRDIIMSQKQSYLFISHLSLFKLPIFMNILEEATLETKHGRVIVCERGRGAVFLYRSFATFQALF